MDYLVKSYRALIAVVVAAAVVALPRLRIWEFTVDVGWTLTRGGVSIVEADRVGRSTTLDSGSRGGVAQPLN